MNDTNLNITTEVVYHHYDNLFKTIGCISGCIYGFSVTPCGTYCDPLLCGILGSALGNAIHRATYPMEIERRLCNRNISNSYASVHTVQPEPQAMNNTEATTSNREHID